MAFTVYEVIRVSNACRKVGLFMFLRPGGVNKVTTRQTSHANDFVNKTLKAMQERNLCSQGIVALALCSIGFVVYSLALKLLKNVCVRG